MCETVLPVTNTVTVINRKRINVSRDAYTSETTSLTLISVTSTCFCDSLSGVNYEVKKKPHVATTSVHVFVS